MMIALLSAKGSPGVTTTALGLAAHWPGPVMLVEADTAGSTIIPGYFGGQFAQDGGIGPLAIAEANGDLASAFMGQTMTLFAADTTKRLLPGVASPAFAPAARDLWGPLASHLTAITGGDILVDLGRLGANHDDRDPLITLADQVVVVTSSRTPDVAVTRGLVAQRTAATDDAAREFSAWSTACIGTGRPIRSAKVAQILNLDLAGEVAWDPETARVFSDGATPHRKYAESALARSYTKLAAALRERAIHRVQRLRAAGGPR
jgi:hypothetical protein